MEVGREWKLAIEVFQTLKYLDPDFCVIFYFPFNSSSKCLDSLFVSEDK